MDTVRRLRLRQLLEGKYSNDRTRLLQDAGVSKGRLSQLLQAGGVFGERAARSLESKLKLPTLYFDTPLDDPSAWPEDVKQLARALVTMTDEARRRAWAVVVALQAADDKADTPSHH